MFTKAINLSVIVLSITLFSCQSESEKKWEETMKVHDEVMLKMQETGDAEMKLDQLITHAKTADSNAVIFSKIDTLQQAYSQLEKADEEMMDWMASIQKPRKGDNQDSIIQYLEKEQKAIIQVGVVMDNAIENANQIIQSLEKK